ncbi:hypothetical protein C3Y87_03910 [Carbonactinospora thermoautotrophica]|uniref:Uncharacterized protein n=2 Tax=Carbonactinospora thermoautotrophica TaxID=1469144 RepID=A0A132N0V0_9ACTN|nr:hypothetical protein [Carbonactinospora thermoautotrophica]KWX02747.1 hypothetical protein LI90_3793 [Carbonactinospora thermoautotrophica]KWX03788.1 hypothetical protein TH66_13465 [Carbonactinospora thermoautotrophica]MCX9190571.1 hypothetical protein [Carbonactinospora thermoautotrophica]
MNSAVRSNRSQAWFRPGRYVPVVYMPVSNIRGVEVLSQSRGGVQISKTTIHGTAAELRALAVQILRAAEAIEPARARRRAANPARRLRAA